MEAKAKKWFKICFWTWTGIIIAIIALVFVVDPYFHFHKPFSFMKYRLYEERYINDGISRHFEYNAIVTGTSMTQNFKPSEVDALFGTNCVKETFSGASYRELSENLERALKRNPDLKTVIWCIDYNGLLRNADYQSYEDYPTYLYDDNLLNDAYYIFNKDVLYHGVLSNLAMTIRNESSTTMDEYAAWDKETGLQYILNGYDREDMSNYREEDNLTEEEIQMVTENIKKNIVDLVKKYPDTTFYLFYSPYSICYWDSLNQENRLKVQLDMEKIATSMMLECDNIRLYNFFNQYDIITNLDNYRDKEHYDAKTNSLILQWINSDTGLLTKDNYLKRLEEEKNYYSKYDYDKIYD